jgi:hypothetical protein
MAKSKEKTISGEGFNITCLPTQIGGFGFYRCTYHSTGSKLTSIEAEFFVTDVAVEDEDFVKSVAADVLESNLGRLKIR